MGLCVAALWLFLLIRLSQAELGRIWAAEQEDAPRGTDGEVSRLYRSAGPQRPLGRFRAVRHAQGERGRDLDIGSVTDNMTHVVDSQKYYRWQSFGPTDDRTEELWVDLSSLHRSQVQIHSILSSTHRRAARVALSFDFPFYGHYLRQITIATGGFIFMGEITHRMLTATQYVAPLMANFDPSFSNNSTVKYLDNGNLFVVQWDKVHLKDREDEGSFTFQAALYRNGTIVFNYKDVPVPLVRINSTEHPVKVGLSDAFTAPLSPQPSDVKQHTIYEYHRVEINTTRIVSGSAFEFTPLPTCLQHTSCELCMTSNLTTRCGWCNTLQRCSDGIDRHRQEWLDYNCPEEAKATCEDYNPELPDTSSSSSADTHLTPTPPSSTPDDPSVTIDLQTAAPDHNGITENTAIIAGVVAALVLLVALTLLAVYYINTHPTVAPPFDLMQRRTNNYWPSMKFRNQGCPSGYAEVELGGHEKEGFLEAEQCY